jgi:hypothetical protein
MLAIYERKNFMKKSIITILIALCLMFLNTSCQTANPKMTSNEDWQAKVSGNYKGIIFSSGIECPGITKIYKDVNGDFKGDYEFIEKKSKVSGTLYDFQIISYLQLKCKWRDMYGIGDLKLSFNDGVTKFNGSWNNGGKGKGLPWNGTK